MKTPSNIISCQCRVCGKLFQKRKNARIPLLERGIKGKNRVTCSKKCSREYNKILNRICSKNHFKRKKNGK